MKVKKLFELISSSCPDYKERIENPTNLQNLYQIEKDNQIKFPDAYFELYSILSEESLCLALGWSFISIERMLFDLSVPPSSGSVICHNKTLVKPFNKSNKRILIADNYDGSKMYLDFDPNLEGNYGQVIVLIENEIIFNVAKDFGSFIDFIYNEIANKKAYFDKDDEVFVFEIRQNKPYHLLWYELSCQFQKNVKYIEIEDIDSELRESIFELNKDYIRPNFTLDDYGKIFNIELISSFNNRIDIIKHFPNLSHLSIDLDETNILLIKELSIDYLSINTKLKNLIFKNTFPLIRKLKINYAPNLEDLNFLKYFPKLEALHIENTDNHLDLYPIIHSISLKNIFINFGKFLNFNFIKELVNVEYIDVSNTNFYNLELLSKIKTLKYLNIENCPIVNPEVLSEFINPISIHCDVSIFVSYSQLSSPIKHKFDSLNGTLTDDEYSIWTNYCEIKK